MADAGFLAAYLAVGADDLKRKVVLERLEKRMAALGDLELNRDVFTGSGAVASEVIDACNTLPFMSEYRLVVIREADKLPKATSEALVSYLGDPNPSTIVVLETAKLAKNTRLYKAVAAVGKQAVINCAPKSKRDLPAQVRDFALAQGVQITQAGAEELIAYVGESTVHLNTELAKLAALLGRGSVIVPEHVRQNVTRVTEVKPWDIADALCARDAKRCAELLARSASTSPFAILTSCVGRIRELLVVQDLGRASSGMVADELGRPEWQVRNYPRWASGFSARELEQALISAADLERAMKSGADQLASLERWMLTVCTG